MNLRRNHRLIEILAASAIAALAALILPFSGQAFAQGFDWSQLLGGGGGGGGAGGGGAGGGPWYQHLGQSGSSGVTIDRGSPPFTGKFAGKKEDQGVENTMTAEFACFPATDTDIPQGKAFVCYTAPPRENASAGAPPYGPSGGAPSYGPPTRGGPPPAPSIE
jgi:hypothetical protein